MIITIIQKIIQCKQDHKPHLVELNTQKFHGMGRNLDPNIKPEKQHANKIKDSIEKPCIDQGRAGLKRKRPDPIN